eukprot:GFUD01124688.1.p1 GENE.GFUD01124688.1~~GFUD01124688.1.p1  ORF type:complete len:203 (+),score=24.46 GFUD01124688.1:85-609(+)
MSYLARSYTRFLNQARTSSLGQVRQMSAGHDQDGWKMWKKIFFLVAVPVIILGHINAFGLTDGTEMDPPPFVPYDHLRLRTKNLSRIETHANQNFNHLRDSPGEMETILSSTTTTQMPCQMDLSTKIKSYWVAFFRCPDDHLTILFFTDINVWSGENFKTSISWGPACSFPRAY